MKSKKILNEMGYLLIDEELLKGLESMLDIPLPKNQYAIKNYALQIKQRTREYIKLKKSHAIELVSRVIFKSNWHVLSKKIPKDFKVEMNKYFISYGDLSIDVSTIDDLDLSNKTMLTITCKNKDKHLIVKKEAKKIYKFLLAHSFSIYTEYYVVKERENVDKFFVPDDMNPTERFMTSILFRAHKEKATQILIEESDGCIVYSLMINDEKRELLKQPLSTMFVIEQFLCDLIRREDSSVDLSSDNYNTMFNMKISEELNIKVGCSYNKLNGRVNYYFDLLN